MDLKEENHLGMFYSVCVCVNSRRQHLCQQLLRFLFLDVQLLRSLPDQLLQVRRVLLQHPQHGVYDVRLPPLVDVLKLSGRDRIQKTGSTGIKYRGQDITVSLTD